MRPIRFPKSKRETIALRNAQFQYLGMPESYQQAEPKRRKNVALPAWHSRRGEGDTANAVIVSQVDSQGPAVLEADVITACSALLAVHPRVLVAIRMNSGMAAYNAPDRGRMQPVWFHKFLRYPEPMKMPDFIGFVDIAGLGATRIIPFAFEAKRGNWKQPSDDRERKQAAFLAMIRSIGGIGMFVTSADQIAEALNR